MKIKSEYECHNGASDEKYDSELWGGELPLRANESSTLDESYE